MKRDYGIKLEVWGPGALFTRPEFSSDRVSYDAITPSAARGLIESIYWHQGVRYVIDRIHVLNPIRFLCVKRNELDKKFPTKTFKNAVTKGEQLPFIAHSENRQQRFAVCLKDVRYVIEAHFDIDKGVAHPVEPAEVISILSRRIEKGQFYSEPYFGCREFPVSFRAWKDGGARGFYSDVPEVDMGLMLHGIDFSGERPRPSFFHAVMRGGVIDVAGSEVYR